MAGNRPGPVDIPEFRKQVFQLNSELTEDSSLIRFIASASS
jgi:hypothetical protein